MSVSETITAFEYNYEPVNEDRDPGLDLLKDGEHDFTIVNAWIDTISQGQYVGVKVAKLRLEAGITVVHSYWLASQIDVNKLGADLTTLGHPCATWPDFLHRVDLLENSDYLKGAKFRGMKWAEKGKERIFHKLRILRLLTPAPLAPPSRPSGNGNGNGAGSANMIPLPTGDLRRPAPQPVASPEPSDDQIPF